MISCHELKKKQTIGNVMRFLLFVCVLLGWILALRVLLIWLRVS